MNSNIQKYLLLLPLIICLIIIFGFHFNGLYGQDAHEFHRYSIAIWDFILNDADPGNFYWPIGYPLVAGFFGLFIDSKLALQVVNLLALYLCIYAIIQSIKIFNEIKREIIFPFVILLFAFSPFVLKSTLVGMSDISSVALTTLSFYIFLKFIKFNRNRDNYFAIILLVLAWYFRYATVLILLVPAIFSLLILLRLKRWKVFINSSLLFLLTSISFIPSLIQNGSLANFYHEKIEALQLNPFNLFKTSFDTPQGHFEYIIPNIFYALEFMWHPGFLFILLPSLYYLKNIKFHSIQNKLLIFSILLYILFIGSLPIQNHRFLLPVIPLFLILCYPCWQRFSMFYVKKKFTPFLVVILIYLQLRLFMINFAPIYRLNQFEIELANKLKNLNSDTIYGFGVDVALKTYLPDKEIVSLWGENYNEFKRGRLVVFNEEKYKAQWEGKSVMNNWRHLQDSYELTTVDSLENNWVIYVIQ